MLAGLRVQYKLAYLQPGLQSICLYSCWQVSIYSTSKPTCSQVCRASDCAHAGRSSSTVQASLPAAWPAEHLLVLVLAGLSTVQASLPAAWPAEHLLVLMLAGLHAHYKLAYLQPGLQSICLYSCWQVSMWMYCSKGYRFRRASTCKTCLTYLRKQMHFTDATF
jgi:hypothetical protein